MLTRFIHLGNAMVVSSAVRRGPYWHLLETCLHDVGYTAAVETVLSAVATRLGLPSLRSLFEAYASQLVESILQSDRDFFRFPPSLLGYENRRQCGLVTFPLLAPMVLVAAVTDSSAAGNAREGAFADHCNKAQKSVAEGIMECFADVVAITILNWIDDAYDNIREVSETIAAGIHRFVVESNDGTESGTLVQRHLDRIVFSIMRTVCDTDHTKDGSISQALNSQGRSERASATFVALNVHRKVEDFTMHYPNTPAFSALTILRSLKWLDEQVGGVFAPSIVYHVIHHLLAAVGGSPLVNEQMRLLHALTIWISINSPSFRDLTLLRTLLRGTIIVLSQSDLARVAQGIIGWIFYGYASLKSLEPTFPDLLGRIARIAHDYSHDLGDPITEALGNELLDWIEKEAWTLSKEGIIKPQIVSALPLWPRHPSGSLAQLAEELDLYQSQPLSDILKNQVNSSDKFRLVRRLRDLANGNAYNREQFCSQDFWHLKSCIPQHREIQDEDIDAFVDLLFKHAAQIRSLDMEHSNLNLVSTLHVQESRAVRFRETNVSPMRSIILSLLNILSTEEAVQIHRAYRTLRTLFALPITELNDNQAWPKPYQDEISYLRLCPLPSITASPRSLKEFDTLEILHTVDFKRWICEAATLLNDVLSGSDPFYAQLTPSIHSDPSFATQMLPVLVHGVLISNQKDARTILSRYFSSILMETGASAPRCQAIVGTILHLRNFEPISMEPADPLAYDKWLDIDFQLLSRGAMCCGAYTTALLFLELAMDYSASSGYAETATEHILYDIYSHIEEPDGFYAIKSSNVHGFLTRRFHHEGQWDMAFKFHGAEFAVGLHGSQGAEGIYQSLHANGFDKLAMAVLQSSSSETIGADPDQSQLGYELAWRTQMWDLPEPRGDGQPGSALYTALRAIHRNRDQLTVDALLKNASRDEMLRLYATGNEDIVGVRSRALSLICLGEIRKWRGATIQDQLASGEIFPQTWDGFINISSEFECVVMSCTLEIYVFTSISSFTTLESVIATRMSLLHSVKQREQREQIGDLESPFMGKLKHLEQKCLLRLSEAARLSENHQTALNAVMHAQRLEQVPSFEVSQEFAHVLWLLKEHKPAVEYLKNLVIGATASPPDDPESPTKALVLSRLVSVRNRFFKYFLTTSVYIRALGVLKLVCKNPQTFASNSLLGQQHYSLEAKAKSWMRIWIQH